MAEFISSTSNTVINGTDENDYFEISGTNVTIYGGAGNDSIVCKSDENVVIIGGTGDDTISLPYQSHKNFEIQYSQGDGNDVVEDFISDYDKVYIAADTYSSTASSVSGFGVEVVLQVGDGKITMEHTDGINVKVEGTQYAENTNENILQKTYGVYNYVGGSKGITDYAGEPINWSTDFTGIGLTDTDFMINSSSGSLTIQDARDKIIDVAVDDNSVAYAYLKSSEGKIDFSGWSYLDVIIGANNLSNEIVAGSGGSSLWGGAGGADTLTGGLGVDNFFYGKNDGSDIINNASSSDVVNLYDVTLADITTADVLGSQISVNFNTGGNLQINSTENLSATFNLADGSWKYNHSTSQWQNS